MESVKLKAVCVAIGALLLLPMLSAVAAAKTDYNSVEYWLPHCVGLITRGPTDKKDVYLAGECLGMIKASAFSIQAASAGGLPFRACLPDNSVTTKQLVTVVLGWMKAHPKLQDQDFIVVTMLAMAATWPCK